MNKIVENAIWGYEVNIWASVTERDNIQKSDSNRVGKVAYIVERFGKSSLNLSVASMSLIKWGDQTGEVYSRRGRT